MAPMRRASSLVTVIHAASTIHGVDVGADAVEQLDVA
jgi:hypothetical protein